MLGLARSGAYRKPRPANDNDLEVMRRIGDLFTVRPFIKRAAHRADAERGGSCDRPQARSAARAADGDRGAGAEAAHQQTRASPRTPSAAACSTAWPNSSPPPKPTSTSTTPTSNRASGLPWQPTSTKRSPEGD